MKKIAIFFSLIIFTVSSSAIMLDQGWNTISVNSEFDISDAIEKNNNCEFERYQGEYIWKYDNRQDDWTHPDTLQPEDGFYLYTDNNCELEVDQSTENNIDNLEMDSGWNMIGASHDQLSRVQSSCDINPHLNNGDFSFLLNGEWYHPLISASEMENRGYWLNLNEGDCQVNFDEELDEPEEEPIEDSYLEFNDAEIVSETVSADGENLDVDFSFDRDSATENDVEAKVGLHIDESSSPVKTFELSDKRDQTVSANWKNIWEEVGESSGDSSAQLVLQKKTEGEFRWNRDSIDVGEFTVERCSSFNPETSNNWELTYEPDNEERCLDKVKAGESSDGSQGLLIRSNQGGVAGSVELRKVYRDTEGTERLTIDLTKLKDSSQIRTSNIEIRHFKGGEGDGWNTVLEDEVYNLDPQSVKLDFSKALSGTHPYNIVEVTVENNRYSSSMDPLEIEGDLQFERYPEDGSGTCQPGQTWCGDGSGGGTCIDDESYSPGLCY
ncbi:MAG: hypothetical protein R6V35_04190 [Candidatus Nanohaloarchaea archaeon]